MSNKKSDFCLYFPHTLLTSKSPIFLHFPDAHHCLSATVATQLRPERQQIREIENTALVMSMGISAFADDDPPAESGEGTQDAQTYSITVTNSDTAMSINGKTYTAYKLFDVTYSGNNYAYSISKTNPFYSNAEAKAILDQYFDFTEIASDANSMSVTVKTAKQDSTTKTLSASDVRALANALQPYATGTGAGSAEAANETATITLPTAGYYIVTGTVKPTDPANSDKEVVSAIILDNADPTAEVKPKASVPTLDKKITAVTDNGAVLDDKGKAAVAKVGSTVSYELDSKVPDLTGYTKYTFTFGDKITNGLDYVTGSFKLKIGNSAETTVTPTIATDGKSFTYSIDFATFTSYLATEGNKPGDAITLKYDCTVNSEALTTDYENNTADLTYSHSPYDDTTNKTPEKETYVIDLNLDVLKVDGSNAETKLDGAKFVLYREVTTTTPAGEEGGEATTSTAKQYYKWADNKVTWVTEQSSADVFETEGGNLKQQVRGLDAGTYYLLETEAPTGYNLLKDPVTVTITATPDSATGVTKVTYSATYGSENAAMTNGVVDLTSETQASKQPVATGTIENNSGAQLPSTGGIGTTIFYVVGSIMVVAAGVLLITKKRMSREG